MIAKLRSAQIRPLIVLGMFVPCFLIVIPAVIAYRAERQLTDSFYWVSHTLEVEAQIQRLLRLLTDAETGQRGYLLIGRPMYLDPYREALTQVRQELGKLQESTRDNPVQQDHLKQLSGLIDKKLEFMARTISMQESGRHDAAIEFVATDSGKHAMDAIRSRLRLMEGEESGLLKARQKVLSSRAQFSTRFLFGLFGTNLLFVLLMLVISYRLAAARNLIVMCAYSRTVEYQGEWLSFEQYLQRRFNIDTSHGISPVEAEKVLERARLPNKASNASRESY